MTLQDGTAALVTAVLPSARMQACLSPAFAALLFPPPADYCPGYMEPTR